MVMLSNDPNLALEESLPHQRNLGPQGLKGPKEEAIDVH